MSIEQDRIKTIMTGSKQVWRSEIDGVSVVSDARMIAVSDWDAASTDSPAVVRAWSDALRVDRAGLTPVKPGRTCLLHTEKYATEMTGGANKAHMINEAYRRCFADSAEWFKRSPDGCFYAYVDGALVGMVMPINVDDPGAFLEEPPDDALVFASWACVNNPTFPGDTKLLSDRIDRLEVELEEAEDELSEAQDTVDEIRAELEGLKAQMERVA